MATLFRNMILSGIWKIISLIRKSWTQCFWKCVKLAYCNLWNVNFGTLMYDGHFICFWSQWLVFKLVIQIQCIWNVNDWYINNSRSIHYLQFLLLISGFYLFSIQYQTKNCGALALCGPTIVDMYQDGGVIRSFERNLAIDNKADTDMVNLETQ